MTVSALPAGSVSVPYSSALTASGGVEPYTWLVTSGTLPAGLELDSTTGILSGTPAEAGQETINIEVEDADRKRVTRTFTLSVAAATSVALSIKSSTVPGGTVGTSYSVTLVAEGGTSPYQWSVGSGTLPAGLELNDASGAISGTPSAAGTDLVGVTVKDQAQLSANATLTFSIAPKNTTKPLSILTSSIPAATVGAGYTFALVATGGTAPYTWSLVSGSLPAGLVLDSSGTITGTPTATTDETVDIQVRDAEMATASESFTVASNATSTSYATYYVDSVAGSDANSGTLASAPWRTVAKVNATSFLPGDHILFLRGDTWRETLSLSSSGQSGDPIVIDAYGSGAPPVLSGADLVPGNTWTLCSSCHAGVWQAGVQTQPNIVIFNGAQGNPKSSLGELARAGDWYWNSKTLYVWCATNPGSYYLSPGVEAGARVSVANLSALAYVTLENLELGGANGLPTNAIVYAHTQNGIPPRDLVLEGLVVKNGFAHGVHLEDCNHCVVQNSTVSGVAGDGINVVAFNAAFPVTRSSILGNTVTASHHDGIATYGCAVGGNCQGTTFPSGIFLSGIIISGNTVHDNGEGIYLEWTNSSSVSANTVYNNTDTTNSSAEGGGIELEASSNNIIEKNLVYTNRGNGIELSNDSGAGTTLTGASNNVIRYNALHDNGGHGLFTNAAPTQSNQFLYNLVWNQVNGECMIADGVGHVFYGNVCWHNSTGIDLYTSSSTPTTGSITFGNNIISNSITRAVHIEDGVGTSTLVFEHNNYDFGAGGEFLLLGTAYTLGGWQSATGLDSHSFVASPQFVSATPTAPSDFAVEPGSPDVGAGAALGSTKAVGLAVGSSWPSGVLTTSQPAAWDIGAFIVP